MKRVEGLWKFLNSNFGLWFQSTLAVGLITTSYSYDVAHRELIPEAIHDTTQYANNRAELSHQPTRVRERGMRCFKSTRQAQRFLGLHAAVYNLFNLGRHVVSAKNYRMLRSRAFVSWKYAAAL
jgi:putative transposase